MRVSVPRNSWSSAPLSPIDRLPGALRFLMLFGLFAAYALSAARGAFAEMAVLIAMVAFAVIVAYGRWWLLLAWIVLTPTLFTLMQDALRAVPFVNGPRLLFAALLGVTVATVLLRRGRAAPITAPEVLMLMMVPFLLVSALTSMNCAPGMPAEPTFALLLDAFVMPYFAFWAARQVSWSDLRVRMLLWLLLGVGAYVAFAGLAQYFTGTDFFSPTMINREIHSGRARGPFMNAVEFGAFLTVLGLLGVLLTAITRNTPGRLLIVGMIGVFLAAVVFSLTRSVWLAIPVGLVWLAIADRRTRPVLVPLIVAGGVALALFMPFILQYGPVAERMSDMVPIYNRVTVYMTALSMGLDSPLTGIGFGRFCFSANAAAYAQPVLGIPAEYIVDVGVPHNEFLHMFAMTGLPGVFLHVLIYGAVVRACWNAAKDPDKQGTLQARLAPYAQAAFVVVLVNALLVDLIYFTALLLLIFFLAGVVTAPRRGGLLAPASDPDRKELARGPAPVQPT